MNLDIKKSRKGKRGRKSTSKIISLENNNNNINTDNLMIVHLPLDEETLNKYLNTDTDTENKNDTETSDNKIDLFFDKNQKISNNKINKLYKQIEKLKMELKELKKKNGNKKDIIVLKSDLDLYNTTFKKTNMKKSNHVCWWCFHNFDSIPIGIPEKMIKKNFYLYGNFCSFNCTLAYINKINDWKRSERISLLHQLYYKLFDITDYEMIKTAPPRETLKITGGNLSIEEFRNCSCKNQKNLRIIIPPMTSLVPLIEENSKEMNKCHYKTNKNIPLNNLKISNKLDKLKLKRNKPLHSNKYSLVQTMGLKTD